MKTIALLPFRIFLTVAALTLVANSSQASLILKDSKEEDLKKAKHVFVAEVLDFQSEEKKISSGPRFNKHQITYLYELEVQSVSKGVLKAGNKLKARFTYISTSAVDPNMSVAQIIPGSGKEHQAREGMWSFMANEAETAGEKVDLVLLRVAQPEKGAETK